MADPISAIISLVELGGNIGTGIWAQSQAKKQQKIAEERERQARAEMEQMKQVFANLDTSNPFANMENKFEDLTVNQKQFDLQSKMFQQSQANILDTLRGSAGGGGVAALAQQLAQQGQLASQQAAAQVGQQEQAIQMKQAGEAARLDTLERKGVQTSREQERQKVGTLLGMAQQETAAYREQADAYGQARLDAISGMFEGGADAGSDLLAALQAGS